MTEKNNGRRWWLQLQFAFFQDKRVRALRRKYGDLALIIYQKMMLKSLENDCSMKFEGLEDTFEEEIAVDIVEDEPGKVSLIKQVMDFLIAHELMIEKENHSYFFPQAAKMSGSEGSSAERMRNKRARDKASQSDSKTLQDSIVSDENLLHDDDIRIRTETDLHLKSDKNKTLDVKSKTDTDQADAASASVDRPASSAAAETAEPPSGDLFSVKRLISTAKRNKVELTSEGIEVFHEEMQESGWMLYGKPVEKRGIVKALRGWAKYHPEYAPEKEPEQKPMQEEVKPQKEPEFDPTNIEMVTERLKQMYGENIIEEEGLTEEQILCMGQELM